MVFCQMSLQIACLRWGIVTVITFVWLFSTMCPHTFLHSAFSNVSSICLPRKRHSHIGCICLAFLNCSFSNVYSNCFSEKRQSHIGCICWTFLHCVHWDPLVSTLRHINHMLDILFVCLFVGIFVAISCCEHLDTLLTRWTAAATY